MCLLTWCHRSRMWFTTQRRYHVKVLAPRQGNQYQCDAVVCMCTMALWHCSRVWFLLQCRSYSLMLVSRQSGHPRDDVAMRRWSWWSSAWWWWVQVWYSTQGCSFLMVLVSSRSALRQHGALMHMRTLTWCHGSRMWHLRSSHLRSVGITSGASAWRLRCDRHMCFAWRNCAQMRAHRAAATNAKVMSYTCFVW